MVLFYPRFRKISRRIFRLTFVRLRAAKNTRTRWSTVERNKRGRGLIARRLTRLRRSGSSRVHLPTIMGQQLNKIIKRRRRAAYLKRKKTKAKLAAAAKKK
jgi:hypothetical protein